MAFLPVGKGRVPFMYSMYSAHQFDYIYFATFWDSVACLFYTASSPIGAYRVAECVGHCQLIISVIL